MRYLFICFICLSSLISVSQIKGRVVDSNNKAVLDASILIKGTKQGTTTNNKGYFSLKYNKACTIIIEHINYLKKEVVVTNLNKYIKITLKGKTQRLNTVDVKIKSKSDSHKLSATKKDIENIPALLGESDILKYLSSQAGINTINGLDGGLYVRGGNSSHNQFLTDGHNIYNPNHISGILSTFDPYAFRTTDTYKSGFPAEYGGKLSSYIDMIPRIGSKKKFEQTLKLGFISSSYKVNGPIIKDNTSFVFTLRSSYLQHIARYYNHKYEDDGDFESIPKYSFYDATLGTHTRISDKLSFSTMTIASHDNLEIDQKRTSKTNFTWMNISSMLKLTYYINDKSRIKIQSGYNQNNTEYKLCLSHTTKNNTKNQTWINKIKYQFNSTDKISVSTGLQHEYSKYNLNSNMGNSNGEQVDIYTYDFNYLAAFVNFNYNINKRTKIESGLRLNKYIGEANILDFCPRLRINYKPANKVNISIDYSKTMQYNTLFSAFSINTPTDLWYPLEKDSNPSICHQYSLNAEYNANKNISSSLGVFYKEMDNIKEFEAGTSLSNLNLKDNLIEGEGYAKGIEADIKINTDRLNLQCNYTLSESSRRFKEINNGKSYYPPFDMRHSLLINTSYKITPNICIHSMWTYSSGTHVTFPVGISVSQNFTPSINKPDLVPIYTDRYNFQLPDSHRLDLNVVITRKKRNHCIKYTIGAYNLYNRSNPTFLYFEAEPKDKYLSVLVPKIKALLPFIPYLSVSLNWK